MNLSTQTKTFVIFFSIAAVGTFASVWINKQLDEMDSSEKKAGKTFLKAEKKANQASPSNLAQQAISTADWKEYADSNLNISFKYPENWKISPAKKQGQFKVLEIDPGKKYYNLKVYVSPKGFLGMQSIPTTSETINGLNALNFKDMLYGIKSHENFFTFDLGFSTMLQPEFKALVHTVNFPK